MFLTVQEGEVRVEADLNLPQNLKTCILQNTQFDNLKDFQSTFESYFKHTFIFL